MSFDVIAQIDCYAGFKFRAYTNFAWKTTLPFNHTE